MTNPNRSQPGDAQRDGTGSAAAGNAGDAPSPVAGDSPTEGTVEGPLAPQASPAAAAATPSEMRPKDNDARKYDGVAEFKKMENHAEDGRA